MNIGRKDLFWSYAASSMRILAGIIIMPVSLRMLSPDEQGIWQIFLATVSIITLLDFGFASSFTRNVTYVFSGVKEIKTTGYETAESSEMDYGLLKSLLKAMRTYYCITALIFFAIFALVSPFYIPKMLREYTGDHQMVWITWFIFGLILAYELYTYYYNSILVGCGKVKRNMQITVISQSVRVVLTVVLLLFGLKFYALVIGLFIADLLNRTLSYNCFYDKKLKTQLSNSVVTKPVKDVIKILAPNSIKLGFTLLGNFLRGKTVMFIAPLFLPLSVIGSYGLTMQITTMIYQLGGTWFSTFYPQISQYTVQERNDDVKRMYIKAIFFLVVIYVVLSTGFILFGQDILVFLKSQTQLLSRPYMYVILLFSLLDMNQGISTGMFTARNEVPFYKSYIIAGVLTVLFAWLMFKFTSLGVWSLILSGGLAMSIYIFWKWPIKVIKDLNVSWKDVSQTIIIMWNETIELIRKKFKI
jgi:Membrane protein involved in the export of O-antigen and teichoic acid